MGNLSAGEEDADDPRRRRDETEIVAELGGIEGGKAFSLLYERFSARIGPGALRWPQRGKAAVGRQPPAASLLSDQPIGFGCCKKEYMQILVLKMGLKPLAQ
jgi:hypothetical protein